MVAPATRAAARSRSSCRNRSDRSSRETPVATHRACTSRTHDVSSPLRLRPAHRTASESNDTGSGWSTTGSSSRETAVFIARHCSVHRCSVDSPAAVSDSTVTVRPVRYGSRHQNQTSTEPVAPQSTRTTTPVTADSHRRAGGVGSGCAGGGSFHGRASHALTLAPGLRMGSCGHAAVALSARASGCGGADLTSAAVQRRLPSSSAGAAATRRTGGLFECALCTCSLGDTQSVTRSLDTAGCVTDSDSSTRRFPDKTRTRARDRASRDARQR